QAKMASIAATVIEGRGTPRRIDIRTAVRHQDWRVLRHDAIVEKAQMEAALSANARPHPGKPIRAPQTCRRASQERVGMGIEDVKGVKRPTELFRKCLQVLMAARPIGGGHVMCPASEAVRQPLSRSSALHAVQGDSGSSTHGQMAATFMMALIAATLDQRRTRHRRGRTRALAPIVL